MSQVSDWSSASPWAYGEMTERRNSDRVIARVVTNTEKGSAFFIYDRFKTAAGYPCSDLNDGMKHADELLRIAE